ncbi:hypothetical protein ES703_118688 [subsurface metagenome]
MANVERYMEFMRDVVSQDVVDTYTEKAIPCPVSGNENLAMLIHMIVGTMEPCVPVLTEDNEVIAAVHDRSMTLTGGWRYPGTLLYHHHGYNSTLSAAGLGYVRTSAIQIMYFNPPVLYAKAYIYHCINSELATDRRSHEIAIGYTIEKVTKDAFIAALVS